MDRTRPFLIKIDLYRKGFFGSVYLRSSGAEKRMRIQPTVKTIYCGFIALQLLILDLSTYGNDGFSQLSQMPGPSSNSLSASLFLAKFFLNPFYLAF